MGKISPGIIIAMLGFAGLMFSFVDSSSGMGGKIPIVLFFLVVLSIGLIYELYPKEKRGDVFGEVEASPREFS